MEKNYKSEQGRSLIRLGIILFSFGLVTGFLIPLMQNPEAGVSSHLEGTINGMLLIIFGLMWHRLHLKVKAMKLCYVLSIYGKYTN